MGFLDFPLDFLQHLKYLMLMLFELATRGLYALA